MSTPEKETRAELIACVECGHEHEVVPPDGNCHNCRDGRVVNLATASREEVLAALEHRPSPLRMVRRDIATLAIAVGVLAFIVVGIFIFFSVFVFEPDASQAIRFRHDGAAEELDRQQPPLTDFTAAVATQAPSLGSCFRPLRAEMKPGFGEALTARWTILDDGSVRDAKVVFTSMPGPVAQCAAEAIARWRFPAITLGTPLVIEVPFSYLRHAQGFTVLHPNEHVVVGLRGRLKAAETD